MHRSRHGFILIQVLLSVMIAAAMIPITILCLKSLSTMLQFSEDIQDEIAVRQLRRILLLSYNIDVYADSIDFVYQEKAMHLVFKNDHMIIEPGTQIFFSAIDGASFYQEGRMIYTVYERNGRSYEKMLGQDS